jgi:TonB family protein
MNFRLRLALRIALALGLTVTALAHAAHGQDAPLAPTAPPPPANTSTLTPPRLVTFVDANYPEAAKTAHLQANVELELTVDVAGKVTDARVITPVGNGFDAAAIEAARRFVFEPAKRGDHAIPARIKYRYVFEMAPEAPPTPTTGMLEGKVLSRGTNQAIAVAAVTLTGTNGAGSITRTAITDAAGAFQFQELPPGLYHVKLAASGLAPLAADEEVTAGDLTSVTYRLQGVGAPKDETALEFGATATIEAPPREVTKRSLSGEELLRVAGTRGDPLKAIEYMPGVGRSPQAEFVIIRGSSPADSEVQFEGAPINRLYHFGGLTSFVQPRLLDKIDLYPGNFSARYGRKMGGIIDVSVRDPKTDALHAVVDINLVDSSFLLEGPLAKNWSFAVAAKRSYMDFFIDKLLPKDEVQVTAAPVYWDYQAMVAYKPGSNDRFRAMVYGSYDDLKLILAHPADTDPSIRGGLSSKTVFHRAQFVWQHKYNAAVEHEINVSTGPFSFDQNVGPDLALQIPGYDGFLRSEWRARLTDQLRLTGGLDISYNWFDFTYAGPRPTQLDGDPDTFGPLTGRQNVQLDQSYTIVRPAAYLEAIWQATDRLTLVPGGRVDYLGDVHRWTVDPRLTARYQLTATTTIKGGIGLFSQAPSGAESLPVLGNPHLRPGHAQHYSLGIEKEVGTRLKLTAEGFYKRLSQLTVNSPVPGENLNNDGIGRIYGGEASAKLRPTEKSSGFLSYTLSRSERNDHGTEWRLFNWDQTHILTIAGAYRLGHSWDLSGTFRYVTGNPITPVVGSIYNANSDTYKPVYGAVNSDRSNAFHRLDLRVEKSWHVKTGSIAAYVDLQNAYNRHNEEGRAYNYNFTQSGVISGLPLIPSLGVRGEL